jgi:uncharacterized membrane protein YhhN
MHRNLFSVLFLLIAGVHVYGQLTNDAWLSNGTKPLLIPALGMALLYGKTFPKRLLGALFFSWLGDVLLMNQDRPLYFMLGLGAFLVAHIFYIVTLWKSSFSAKSSKTYVVIITVSIVAYLIILLQQLTPHLGDFLIPVYLYAAVITCMLWIALNRKGKTNSHSFLLVAAGAGFFVISDSLIAWNKFANPLDHAGIYIMATYLIAQACLVSGIAKSS